MKAIKNMLYIAAMATAITACTSEDALVPELNTPLTVSATIPGDVWAVASRSAEGEDPSSGSSSASRAPQYSDWTLHYTNYKGEAATYSPNVSVNNGTASFTTGTDLVWEQIDATQSMHLTCKTDNGTADNAEDDESIEFPIEGIAEVTDEVNGDATFAVILKTARNLANIAMEILFQAQ